MSKDIMEEDITYPVITQENRELEITSLSEELATAILGRMTDVDKLKLRFIDSSLTHKDKLNSIIQFKISLLIPALRKSLGLSSGMVTDDEIQGTYDVFRFLESVETSIKNIINYEDNEVIDFTHPKIVESYRMLFEIVVEIINEEVKEPILVNNIIEKTAVRCIGIENEFNKIFKKLSNKMSAMVKNPMIRSFEEREKDPEIVKLRLLEELWRAKKVLNYQEIDNLIEVLNESKS